MRLLFQSIALASALVASSISARADEPSSAELAKARKLYTTKCARCHKLYAPEKYSDEEWQHWMSKMTKKAKLNPDQTELLSQYVNSLRANTNSLQSVASSRK
jgi:mono/diheme cytochrome c family protein